MFEACLRKKEPLCSKRRYENSFFSIHGPWSVCVQCTRFDVSRTRFHHRDAFLSYYLSSSFCLFWISSHLPPPVPLFPFFFFGERIRLQSTNRAHFVNKATITNCQSFFFFLLMFSSGLICDERKRFTAWRSMKTSSIFFSSLSSSERFQYLSIELLFNTPRLSSMCLLIDSRGVFQMKKSSVWRLNESKNVRCHFGFSMAQSTIKRFENLRKMRLMRLLWRSLDNTETVESLFRSCTHVHFDSRIFKINRV